MIRGSHMTIASGIRVCGVEIDLYLYYHLLSLFSPLLTMLGTVSIQQPLKPSLSICHGAGQSSSRRSRPSMSNICAKLVTVKKGRKEGILSPLLPISMLLHVFFVSDSVESEQTCNHRQKSGLLVRWQLRRSDSFLIRPSTYVVTDASVSGVHCKLSAYESWFSCIILFISCLLAFDLPTAVLSFLVKLGLCSISHLPHYSLLSRTCQKTASY